MKPRIRIIVFVLCVSCFFLLAADSRWQRWQEKWNEQEWVKRLEQRPLKPPEVLFEKAEKLYHGRTTLVGHAVAPAVDKDSELYERLPLTEYHNYSRARDLYQRIVDNYPYSKFTPLAELRMADCSYEMERFDEAIMQYENFIKYRQARPEVPYAMYKLASSHKGLMLKVPRDQTFTKDALRWFKELQKSYPDSEYAQKAETEISALERQLAEREMYVAEFYFKQQDYWAAILRYATVIREYRNTGLAEEAMFQMARSYQELQRKDKALAFYQELVDQFPQSEYAAKAKARIKDLAKQQPDTGKAEPGAGN